MTQERKQKSELDGMNGGDDIDKIHHLKNHKKDRHNEKHVTIRTASSIHKNLHAHARTRTCTHTSDKRLKKKKKNK